MHNQIWSSFIKSGQDLSRLNMAEEEKMSDEVCQ